MVRQLSLLAIAAAMTIGAQSVAAQASSKAAGVAAKGRALHLVLAPEGNEARYKVREQLVGFDFPNDAVGKTSRVTGMLMIGTDGKIVKDSSSFTVDLASIASDKPQRDNYVRTRTLMTAQHPTAVFVPTSAVGLPAVLPTSGEVKFDLIGDLTVHGVTKPSTWKVVAKMGPGESVAGTASTSFKFGDFNMTVPSARSVLSVVDVITLEYDFTLVPKTP
jgi:polyisoprenoid-binding protein YceI